MILPRAPISAQAGDPFSIEHVFEVWLAHIVYFIRTFLDLGS